MPSNPAGSVHWQRWIVVSTQVGKQEGLFCHGTETFLPLDTGGVEGLWELGIAELQSGNKLASCSVTTISASAQFLAVGHEHGGLTLFTGEPNSWTQSGSLNDGPEIQGSGYCITSLLQDLRTKGKRHSTSA